MLATWPSAPIFVCQEPCRLRARAGGGGGGDDGACLTVVQPAIRGIAHALPNRPGLGSVGLLRQVTEDPTYRIEAASLRLPGEVLPPLPCTVFGWWMMMSPG